MLLSLFTRVSIYSSKFSKIVPKSRQEMVNLESLVQIIIFLNNFNVICWLEFGGGTHMHTRINWYTCKNLRKCICPNIYIFKLQSHRSNGLIDQLTIFSSI